MFTVRKSGPIRVMALVNQGLFPRWRVPVRRKARYRMAEHEAHIAASMAGLAQQLGIRLQRWVNTILDGLAAR
jgi:hypothetical protein